MGVLSAFYSMYWNVLYLSHEECQRKVLVMDVGQNLLFLDSSRRDEGSRLLCRCLCGTDLCCVKACLTLIKRGGDTWLGESVLLHPGDSLCERVGGGIQSQHPYKVLCI